MNIAIEEQLKFLSRSGQIGINARLDECTFYDVSDTVFNNDILPYETNNSKNVYIVTSQNDIQLWKGSVRIPLTGGSGITYTSGVIYFIPS